MRSKTRVLNFVANKYSFQNCSESTLRWK